MELGNNLCKLCEKEFEPYRRGVQKFCSSHCRKKYSYHKNKTVKPNPPIPKIDKVALLKDQKNKTEEMSLAGIGNAALGNLAVDTATAFAKELFVPHHKKTATKGYIQELKDLINTRYFEVHNISPDYGGRIAYFDMALGKIVYYNEQQNRFELPLMDF